MHSAAAERSQAAELVPDGQTTVPGTVPLHLADQLHHGEHDMQALLFGIADEAAEDLGV